MASWEERRATAAALREEGSGYAESGDFAKALEAFGAATRADPRDAKAQEAVAQVLLLVGEDDDERVLARAVAAAREACALAPLWAPAAVTLGRALLAARRWREAAAAFRHSLALDFGADVLLRVDAEGDLAEARRLQAESEAATAAGAERTLSIGGRPLLTVSADVAAAAAPCGCPRTSGPAVGVWECGVVLAMFLEWREASGEAGLAGKRVLELGSGLGVAGLSAALLGASVVLTDLGDVVPRTAERVAAHASLVADAGGAATTRALDWREPGDVAALGDFDVVLAADAVYTEAALGPFVTTLDAVCQDEAYVCHKKRHDRVDDALELELRARFDFKRVDKVHPLYRAHYIDVYHLKRKAPE